MVMTTSEGWQVEARPSPESFTDTYRAPEYVEPEPEHDEWLEAHHRLSDADRAALAKVYGIGLDVMP